MKGYQRIQIPQDAAKRQQLDSSRGHQKDASGEYISGTLEAKMRVVQPVHVGTGDLVNPSTLNPAPDNPHNVPLIAPFFRESYRICIPGTSIKGTFRHLYEIVTASCLAQADTGPKGAPVGDHLKSCSYRSDSRDDSNANKNLRLCPTCRVFGALGYLGQIFFNVAYPEEGTNTEIQFAPQRWSPRIIEEGSRKLYSHEKAFATDRDGNILIGQYPKPKEPLEVLVEESVISLTMNFTSLLPSELGLLLLIMGQKPDEKIYPKLGGVKAHGWGAIDIHAVTIHHIDKHSYLNYEHTSSSTQDVRPYFDALENSDLLNSNAWDEVRRYLSHIPEDNNA